MNLKKFGSLSVLALIAGGLASALSLSYMRQVAAAERPAPVASHRVAVAARALPPGTVLTEADLRLVPWAAGKPPASLYSEAEQLVGRTVIVPIDAEEPLLDSYLTADGAGAGLAGMIPSGMRAVSLPVDHIVGVSGFVLPGTRVDVIATIEPAGGGPSQTRLVLQDVQALAAGHALQASPEGTPQEVNVVTVLVTPEQAEQLVAAMHRGRLQLSLRGRLEHEQVVASGADGSGSASRQGQPSSGASATRPAPRRNRTHSVEVIRGIDRTVVDMSLRPAAGD